MKLAIVGFGLCLYSAGMPVVVTACELELTLGRIRLTLKLTSIVMLLHALVLAGGCATIRITDPEHTADELYLENVASKLAVDQVSASVLRDRKVYLDSIYLTATSQPTDQQQYLLGELRSKLLLTGVRLTSNRKDADVIMEVRSQGISVDHIEFLLGLPQSSIGGIFTGGFAGETPEIAIIKRTQQHGFASVAYIAYWADTGEVVAASGPFVGRTIRDDYWFFGYGPRTIGNIPPAEPAPIEGGNVPAPTTPAAAKPAPPPAPPPRPTPAAYKKL